jgi:hypothetical protein
MQSQITHSGGLIASSYVDDPVDLIRSHARLQFLDHESQNAFEASVAYSQYIWEVLPLLSHKPRITEAVPQKIPGGTTPSMQTNRPPSRNAGKNMPAITILHDFVAALCKKLAAKNRNNIPRSHISRKP